MKKISTTEKRKINVILMAVLSLKMELSDQRYGIIKHEETKNDEDQNYRDQIIAEIKQKYNKDFYQVIASKDVEAMLEYENLLSNYLDELLRQYTNPESVDDNLKILDISHDIKTLDIFQGKKVELEENVRATFKEIKESIKYIDNYIYNPDYISVIDASFLDEGTSPASTFILTKKVQNKNGVSSIFFAMLSHRKYYFEEMLKIDLALLINYKINEVRYNSPIKLFLYIINRYGFDLELNGQRKKLFFGEDISQEDFAKAIKFHMETLKNKSRLGMIRGVGKENKDAKTLDFAFSFDYGKYIYDYNSKLI